MSQTITKAMENTETADISELNKKVTVALEKATNEICLKHEKGATKRIEIQQASTCKKIRSPKIFGNT